LSDNIGLSGIAPASSSSSRRLGGKWSSSRNSIASGFSASTDDFQSACGDNELDDAVRLEDDNDTYDPSDSANLLEEGSGFFGKDILVVSRQQAAIPEESVVDHSRRKGESAVAIKSLNNTETLKTDTKMKPESTSASTKAAPVTKSVPDTDVKKETEKDKEHFDVAQNVYCVAKSVWTFGRSIPVGGAILGLYEAAAGKVLGVVVHKDFKGVDDEIKPHLAALDKSLIDPALLAVVKFFSPVVEKGGEVVSPIVMAVLNIFPKQIEVEKGGKLKEEEKEEKVPELSTPVATPAMATAK